MAETKLAIILQPLPKTGGGRGSRQQSQQGGASGSGTKRSESGDASASVTGLSKSALKRQKRVAAKESAAADLAKARSDAGRASAAAKAAAAQQPGKGAGKSGKRDKDKSTGGPAMPRELVGMAARTRGGVNCCYAFNMSSGCTKALPGESCDKGLHGCMVPLPDGTACGKPHCAPEH